ncbi:MAG: RNA methyltransferase, partial [Leptolyngbya sp. RL_3_1]|nr:RNA methyltransferase [Leptolyngbya sp. RL_3_1]
MNLGALCRTAEVLGLAELVLPTLELVNNWQFRQLPRAAERSPTATRALLSGAT